VIDRLADIIADPKRRPAFRKISLEPAM